MRSTLLRVLLLLLFFWAPGYGQGQSPANKTYVLKAARLFDGKSNTLVTPGLVVATGGKIAVVGASANTPRALK